MILEIKYACAACSVECGRVPIDKGCDAMFRMVHDYVS